MTFNLPNDITTALRDAAAPLLAAWPVPEALNDHMRRVADLAVAGKLLVTYNGEREINIGRPNPDWFAYNATGSQNYEQVARMSHMAALCTAWRVTGDAEYANAAADYMPAFAQAFPNEKLGDNNATANTLTIGIRNKTWVQALHLFSTSDAFTDDLLKQLVAYIAPQLQYLSDHMSTTINWRVHNARDLMIGALYLPFLDQADAWRDYGVAILNDAWFRQFLPDGVHSEVNPVYHVGMTHTFELLYNLAQTLPQLGLHMSLDRLDQSMSFALGCSRPNGYLNAIHDSQGDHTGHSHDGKYDAGHKAVNTIDAWKEFRTRHGLPLTYPAVSQYFPDAGMGYFRTSWDEDAQYVTFDATRWGGGHCHLSRNAVQLHAHRRSMLVDPGWLEYSSNEWGVHGRSTRAHNTCNLAGLNQIGTDPCRTTYFGCSGYDVMFSMYEAGYWDTELKWNFTHAGNGYWAQHARTMLFVHDRFMMTIDSMYRLPRSVDESADKSPSFELNWQLSAGGNVALADDGSRADVAWPDSALSLLFPLRPESAKLHIHAGERDPLRGWLPGDHEHIPAEQVCLLTPRMEKQHDYMVTLAVPSGSASALKVEAEGRSPEGTIGWVRLRWEDGSCDEVHWGCGFNIMLGRQDEFETDSSMVHLQKDASGRVISGGCIQGTYLRPWVDAVRPSPSSFNFTV